MKKFFALLGLVVFMFSCKTPIIQYEFPALATRLAKSHEVAICTIFYMGQNEYDRRLVKARQGNVGLHYLEGMAPLGRVSYLLGYDNLYAIAYLGAGCIIKDNHILTVRHLFIHGQNTVHRRILVYQRDTLMACEAELVAISHGEVFHDDYAVIQITTPKLNLPGLKLATAEGRDGEPIIFIGTTGGLAFHTRYSLLTHAFRIFERDGQNILLNQLDDFDLVMTYPGGAGDSGGVVVNAKGELLAMMYCGMEVYSEEYIFANPIKLAWEFLINNKLEGLVR